MYQCAYNETGPLLSNFSDQFTPAECRQMLNTMSYNRIGSFIEMGTPLDVRVAHKHGWISDTHGDAALVFSPGGDYILVMALRGPDTLLFGESSVVIEEASRLVYNYFNPTAPLAEVREATTESATCNLLGSPAIESLIRADVVTP
jgi:beta-lactamase class A